MKKNRMMRLASGLLVAVLITTSMISGTFAKYTTQDSASDSARVAKWGVELQAVGNLYGESYGANNKIVEDELNGEGVTVQSLNMAADVVAPGTENAKGMTFSLKGQPEVDGKVTTTMKIQNVFLKKGIYGVMIPVDDGVITKANFNEFAAADANVALYTEASGVYTAATAFEEGKTYYTLEDYVEFYDDYYPVVYNLAGKTATMGASIDDSLKKAADAIATKLGLTAGAAAGDTSVTYTGTKKFDSNTDLASWDVDGLTLTWAWAFGDEAKVGDSADWTDKADTILGMLENTTEGTVVKSEGTAYKAPIEYTDYCLDTQFSIDITVTQVD